MNIELTATRASDKLTQGLNAAVPILIGIYLFFNPFPHTTSIKEIFYYLAVAIVFGLWIFKKKFLYMDTPLTRALLLFLLWAIVTTPFAIDKANTIHDIYSHLIRYILLYIILMNYFDSRKKFELLINILITSAMIFIVWAIYYYYWVLDHNFITRIATKEAGALSQTPINTIGFVSLFAYTLALNYMFATKDKLKWLFYAICLLLMVIAIFLSQTRGVIIALFIVSIILLFPKNKWLMLMVISLIMLLIFLSPLQNRFFKKSPFKEARIKIYFTMWEIIKDYPVTGIGYGMKSYSALDPEIYDQKIKDESKKLFYGKEKKLFIDDPHNWVVGLLVRTGFVGFGLYSLVILSFFKMARQIRHGPQWIISWKSCMSSFFIGFLVIGLFEPTFTHMVELILHVTFAMMTIIWLLSTERGSVKPDTAL